jgi:hypothetical protein
MRDCGCLAVKLLIYRLLFFAGLFFAGLYCKTAHADTFVLTTLDESGAPLPCRILVRGSDGRCAVPDDAVTLQTGQDRWFMSSGRCRVNVPNGDAMVRIERGPEYVRIKEHLRISSGSASKTYQLRRWIDMRQRGYLCGENHLHVDSVQLAPMLVSEGLDFGTSLTWWRGPDERRPVPKGEGRVRLLEFAGHKVPTSIYDAELEYAWGAAYIQNLPAPLPLEAEPNRPNLDYLRHAAAAGAIVHYQGGWSREVLLDALLGCVHTVNVCNNNFALHRFQPRSRYSNLLEVQNFPVYADTDIGMLKMNTDTYYRLLNCGLRLAAGSGSATGVKQAPVGYNRAYVRSAPGDSLDEFYKAWKAGRNFVTNGPMLMLRTESGGGPGDTIQLPKEGGTIKVHVEAHFDQPLASLEIVVNGEVAKAMKFKSAKSISSTIELRIAEGSWITARCTAEDRLLSDNELKAYKDPSANNSFRVAPSRLRFAHTSPIYVTVDGQHVSVRKSVVEGFQMLERFEVFSRKNAGARYQATMTNALETARARLLAKAARQPGDEPPSYSIHRTMSEITIDGRLDEAAWRGATAVGDFKFPWWKTGLKEQTVSKLLWNDEFLYVAFRCDDAHIWAEQIERDSPVYQDDCVELFTAPNSVHPFNYFNIEMNVGGAFLDRHHPSGPGKAETPNWNARGVRIATTVDGTLNDDTDTDRSWMLEAAIPFANFASVAQHTPPHLEDVWHLNLNRLGGKTNPQYSQWSPGRTERPQFHAPQYFGRVIFRE